MTSPEPACPPRLKDPARSPPAGEREGGQAIQGGRPRGGLSEGPGRGR